MNNLKMKMIVGVKLSAGIKKNVLAGIGRDEIYTKKHQVILKSTVVYAREVNFLFGRLIVIYNPKYEAMKRDKMLADNATDNEVKFVGYSLIFHNTAIKTDAVVRKYFDKDIVERSFRTMKGEEQLHPVRLWAPQRINAHVKICYLSMCLLSLIQFRCKSLNISAVEALELLSSIYQVNLKHAVSKKTFRKVVTQNNQQKNILKKLKCSV
jgi:transposase